MSKLKISIPHSLPTEEALGRVRQMLSGLKEEQKDKIKNLEEKWEGNSGTFSFSAMGFDLAGSLNVQPGSVEIDASLPMALSFFKGKISEIIESQAKKVLS